MLDRRLVPMAASVALFLAMVAYGAFSYDAFLSPQVFLNLAIDNAFLLVVAVGMTFVILTGGIDLSVGAVVALSTILSASLLTEQHWNPLLVIFLMLLIGSGLGAGMGAIIHFFEIQPF